MASALRWFKTSRRDETCLPEMWAWRSVTTFRGKGGLGRGARSGGFELGLEGLEEF